MFSISNGKLMSGKLSLYSIKINRYLIKNADKAFRASIQKVAVTEIDVNKEKASATMPFFFYQNAK